MSSIETTLLDLHELDPVAGLDLKGLPYVGGDGDLALAGSVVVFMAWSSLASGSSSPLKTAGKDLVGWKFGSATKTYGLGGSEKPPAEGSHVKGLTMRTLPILAPACISSL